MRINLQKLQNETAVEVIHECLERGLLFGTTIHGEDA